MTVFNTGYCTIDEAWGDLTSKPKNNKKKKSPQDPICDLYESKTNSSSYTDSDLVKFANEYYDKYDKSKYQRNMKTQSMAYEEVDREPLEKSLVIKPKQNTYDVSTESRAPSKNNNSSLFEKQFEMKLPPLYDTGDECPMPSSDNDIHKFRGQNIQQVTDEEWNINKPNLYDDDKDRMFTGSSSQMGTYAEVGDEHNLINSSSDYKAPIKNTTYMERFSEGEGIPQRRTYDEDERIRTYGEDVRGQRRSYAEDERGSQRRTPAEDEKTHFFDEYDEAYNYQSYKKKNANLQILDLILYIISGVILIFLLEQFVKIGINMQR